MTANLSNQDFDNRLEELGGINALGLEDFPSFFPQLFPLDLSSNNPIISLKYSILILWHEVIYAYGYGLSQISIIGCRAVTERTLHVVYHSTTGKILTRGPLGTVIQACREVKVDGEIIRLAEEVGKYGNDRAHANLERQNPTLANLGGKSRGVEFLDSSKYVVHPYKGEAKQAIFITKEILISTFG